MKINDAKVLFSFVIMLRMPSLHIKDCTLKSKELFPFLLEAFPEAFEDTTEAPTREWFIKKKKPEAKIQK